jgi:Anti-sigma-K factor rskA, C-terminal
MNHDQWLEQADVYAAGALDGWELAEFEAHLATDCAICDERLRETREALTLMPRSLPEVPPPPALRARVLAKIAAERPPAAAPVALRPSPRRNRAIWWAGWAGLAAAAALLVVVNAELGTARQELRALQDRLATLQTELTQREEALRFLSDPNVRYVSLGGLKPTPEASAWLLWNPTTRQGLLLARGLPVAPAGHAYELWALAGAQPVPAGVFSADAGGRALLRLPPLPEGHTYDAFAVTLEPAPGGAKPTGPMHLHGKVL